MAKMLAACFLLVLLGTSFGRPDISSTADNKATPVEQQSKVDVQSDQVATPQQESVDNNAAAVRVVDPSVPQVESVQSIAEASKPVPVDARISPDADPSTDGSKADLETDSTLWGGWGGYRSYKPYWGSGWSNYGYYNPWRRYSGGYWGGRGYNGWGGYGNGWGWGGYRGGYYW